MIFYVIGNHACISPQKGFYLIKDNWNDYAFETMFGLAYVDQAGISHKLGRVKIGFKGQDVDVNSYEVIPKKFRFLDGSFFSIGEDIDYYKKLSTLEPHICKMILVGLRDIVNDNKIIDNIIDEEVFGTSLLRGTSISVIKGQYYRVLNGLPEITDYYFKFKRPQTNYLGGLEIDFDVIANSLPATNIHALIGRNGVGKTTILNSMINSVIASDDTDSRFYEVGYKEDKEIPEDYFSSIVSVSFSAFDPFVITKNQLSSSKSVRYFYIGLKNPNKDGANSSIEDLLENGVKSLITCFSDSKKIVRWSEAINMLKNDEIFNNMGLEYLKIKFFETLEVSNGLDINISECINDDAFIANYSENIIQVLESMSSGHAITLLTITHLVATVEEKTLILIDEPESHLHPPLLSSFIRSLSELLYDRNGVAILATHSPVVLQEIPKSCVSKIYRIGSDIRIKRPDIETFAENVGTLTSEVFGLEATRSGFHDILKREVDSNKDYDEIIHDFKKQLGLEGRAILKSLISIRDKASNHDALE